MAINRKRHAAAASTDAAPALPPGYARVAPIHAQGDLIRLLRGNPDGIFGAAKIDERDLADPEGILPVASRGELLERAAQETGCEHFGLLLGARSGIRELGLAGQMMLGLASVGLALEAFAELWLRNNPSGLVFLGRSGDQVSLGYAVLDGNIPGMPELQDCAMAFALKIMRDMLGPDWRPSGITLMRREPRDPAFYARFLGGPCRFNALRSELIFPATTLDFQLNKAAARGTGLERYGPDDHDWFGYVQRVVYRLLLQGECRRARVAAALGLSSRTLVRKLAIFGISYQQLLEGARYSAGRTLMRETELPLAEIAAALGYNDSSSFSRAFQRWSGRSPSQWRKSKVEQA